MPRMRQVYVVTSCKCGNENTAFHTSVPTFVGWMSLHLLMTSAARPGRSVASSSERTVILNRY
jgi:hypothetical protein